MTFDEAVAWLDDHGHRCRIVTEFYRSEDGSTQRTDHAEIHPMPDMSPAFLPQAVIDAVTRKVAENFSTFRLTLLDG